MHGSLGGDTARTSDVPVNQRDIPGHMTSCSVHKVGGKNEIFGVMLWSWVCYPLPASASQQITVSVCQRFPSESLLIMVFSMHLFRPVN